MGWVLDLFELLIQALESLAKVFRGLLDKSAHQPLLTAGGSRRMGLFLRLLLLIPFMIFVPVPVLLGDCYLLQNHLPDQPASVDLSGLIPPRSTSSRAW